MQNSKETPHSKQTTPSSQSKRKSKRYEMGTPSSLSLNMESERQQKNDVPTPLRRSDRGKNNFSSCSSGSKISEEDSSQSDSKRKKKRALIQVTMESEKAELEPEPISINRKKMNARTFMALFKEQRIQEFAPEMEGPDKSSHNCSDDGRGLGSKPMINGKDGRIDKASDGALWMSTFNKKGCHGDFEDDINVYSSIMENALDEPLPLASQTSFGFKTFDYSEKLLSNEKMDTPESESSTCLARSRDSSVSSESQEEWIYQKGPSLSPSLEYDNRNLMGTCVLCSKNKRVGYDSPEQELCACNPTENDDLCGFSSKDRNDHDVAVTMESTENYLREVNEDSQAIGQGETCTFCYKDGKLLFCVGRGCKRCYHLYCLDPPLTDFLPGAWYCPQCVKKKLLFGVHSVSKGVESIWDVREVEISNLAGVQQKQYLVKYHGLSHIHNHWVPEKQLLHENPGLIAKFIDTNKTVRWCTDWALPKRLLSRRIIQDNIYIASSTVISVCNSEWLVKWCGLSYDDATWELECAPFLGTSLSQKLMNDYGTRRTKAHQESNKHLKSSITKLSKLTTIQSLVTDNLLNNVNKLRECLSKFQNAVVFDDQERVSTIILLIQSMSEICWPYLIVTASSLLSQWEAEFAELVPSVDLVVYSGNNTTRKGARASEFYDEEGYMMLQVLLTSPEVLLEDLDILKSIRWEAIVIDEHQHSWASNDFEQIKMLSTDSRILLCGVHIKDSASEYLRILSLLESQDDLDKLRGLKAEPNDYVCKLRDRLSCFSAYGSTSQASKFLEYWVPVEMSNHQLEQYCFTLLSNATSLQSCLTKDYIGAVRDVLLTVRKCCDHPYLLDPSVQERLIAEKCTASDLLDIGIRASGKLQLLDMMLTEIKARGLQVLILFQLIMRPGGASTGDILDDYLRQRFGQYTYERVEAGIISSKKQAAVDRFNKENGPFAFLIETRACTSVIKKLSSVDAIIIYDSDWNPANDLRALLKISVDSKAGQIKVFRLYSCFTVEERALVLAKQSLHLDSHLQNFSRATSDSLLSWGAVDQFRKLDKYHANGSSTSDQMLWNEVTKEFQALLSGSPEDTVSNAVISKARLDVQSYTIDIPLFGESKVDLRDGVEPHVFWSNLFYGKNPHWKHLSDPGPRNRKRVRPGGSIMSKPDTEKDDVAKKPKRMGHNLDPALGQTEGVNKEPQVTVAEEGFYATNQSQNLQKDNTTSNTDQNCMSGQGYFGEKDSLLSFLLGQMIRLCQILQLSEDVAHAMRRFLEYIIKNHHVNNDSPSIMHAFQISLCWIAASIRKQKVDKKNSLMLAKQILNYQCTEEQVVSVYSKMRLLKRMYLRSFESAIDSDLHGSFTEDDTNQEPFNFSQGNPEFLSHKQKHKKAKIGEESGSEELSLLLNEFPLANSAAAGEIDPDIIRVLKKGNKKMKKLKWKHQTEIEGFHESWDKKRVKLETDHKLESAMIRSIHDQGAVRMNKLSLLDDRFAEKIEEHDLQKNEELKKLEARQLASVDELRQKVYLLVEPRVCPSELRAVNGPEALGSHSEDDAGDLLQSSGINTMGIEGAFTMGKHMDQNKSESLCIAENDTTPSVITLSAPAVALSSGTPVENVSTANLQNEVGAMQPTLDMTEHLNQSKHSCDNGETVFGSLSAPGEKDSNGCKPVDASEEFLTEVSETLLNEIEERVHHVELNNITILESSRKSNIAFPDTLVSRRDELDKDTRGFNSTTILESSRESNIALPDTFVSRIDELDKDARGDLREETLEQVEEAISVPGCSESFPQQAQQRTIGESPASADVPASQNQNISHIEVTAVPIDDASAARQSNQEGTVVDETALRSNNDAPVTENSSELNSPSVAAGLSCNVSSAIEDHNHGRSSSPTAEFFREQMLSQESISDARERLETHGIDLGPVTDIGDGQSIELSEFPQNNVATAPIEVRSVEQTNQAVRPGVNPSPGPGYLAHPSHQPHHPNSAQSLLPDPLQIQFERIREETEQLEKNQENSVLQLKLECENEMQEIVSQIRKKYDLKMQETESEYRLKKIELDKNKNKVLMNKILAEAFRSKCLDLKTSRIPGTPSSFVQHACQVPAPAFSVATSSQPAPSQPTPTPPVQSMPSPSQSYPVLLSPASSQTTPTLRPQSIQRPPLMSGQTTPHPQYIQRPPLMSIQTTPHPQPMQRPLVMSGQTTPAPCSQSMQRPSLMSGQSTPAPHPQPKQRPPLISGTPSRPPLFIGSISPSGNLRFGGEIRSRAPHLQPFRPRAPTPAPVPTSSAPLASQFHHIQSQPLQPTQSVVPPPPPRQPPVQPNVIDEGRQGQPEPPIGMTVPPDQRMPILGSVRETESLHAAPQVCSSVENVSHVEESTGVVCLSDDQ